MTGIKNILNEKEKNLKPVYLIYGESNFLINDFIEKFLQKFAMEKKNKNIIYLNDTENNFLKRLNRIITTIPLIAMKKIIIANCEKYFKSAQNDDKKLRSILKKINDEVILLITVDGDINKKLGLINDLNKMGELVNLRSPKYRQLDKWIKDQFAEHGKNIDSKSIKLLEHLFNNQLQRLNSEIEKICTYNIEKKNLVYNDLKDIVSRDRMLADNTIFSFIDAFCLRKKGETLVLLKEMLKDGEFPLRILANIVWQIKLLIQVKELKQKGDSVKKIARILKQHPYPVEKAYKRCENFKEGELEIILEKIFETNVDIVYGKYTSPELAMEMMVNKII